MPLLLARRWPLLTRAAPTALGSRCPSQRSYAVPSPSSTTAADEGPRPKPFSGGIIIPASLRTHPRHLFKSIKALPLTDARRKTFTVLFVTPSYAHYLLDDDTFLRNALLRIYEDVTKESDLSINALCAVVDKVPAPRPWKSRSLGDELSRRKAEPPIAGSGFEGIAYVSLVPDASVPSYETLSPSDNGAIDFITAEHLSENTNHLDTLRLPLANTVFQTGTPTTMFQSIWNTTGTQGELTPVAKTSLSHHGIRLDRVPYSLDDKSALGIPLIPLTLPRVVEGCMGNIIRRVVDADGKTVQASSELEDVVPRYFASRGKPAQATVAWALVIPSNLKDTISARTEELFSNLPAEEDATSTKPENAWERLWRSNPSVWNTLVSQALSEGARLHRVLSGGGGWGKKAGLLSLDPVPISSPYKSTGPDSSTLSDDPSDFESTLTPVVRDGDSIQFFILPKAKLDHEAHQYNNYEAVTRLPRTGKAWGWELGTVPSTMDAIPGKSWQHEPAKKTRYTLFENSFGALTEGAMTLTRRRWNRPDGTSSVYATTLDVPFSRFWAINSTTTPVKQQNPEKKETDGVGKDKDRIPNQDELNFVLSKSGLNSSQLVRSVLLDTRSFPRKSLGSQVPVQIRTFSSTTARQAEESENNAADLKNSITRIERTQPIHQGPKAEESPIGSELSTHEKDNTDSPPTISIPKLVNTLGITGVRTYGKLSIRTAKAILRELKQRFDYQEKQYHSILSACRARKPPTRTKNKKVKKTKAKPSPLLHPTTEPSLIRRVRSDDTTFFGKRKSLVRKMGVNTEHTLGLIINAHRILAFRSDRLIEEAGSTIVDIRLRRLSAELRPRRHRRHPRLRRMRVSGTSQRRVAPKKKKSSTITTTTTTTVKKDNREQPRVRRIRSGSPPIRRHPSVSIRTPRYHYRYPDERRRTVLRRVAVEWKPTEAALAAKRRVEAATLRRQRMLEVERLEATVESWLNVGNSSGGSSGIGEG